MKIGIIGAGISGLTAGRVLAKAGHEVTLFEKNHEYGGRMSTKMLQASSTDRHVMDSGLPYLSGLTPEFQSFIKELSKRKILSKWSDTVSLYSDGVLYPENPGRDPLSMYVAPGGMNQVGKYLGRWLECYFSEKVGGVTYTGGTGMKKKAWMINSSSINVFEADAVIIATPAVQAYGLVSTSQDEFELRKLVTQLDDISYSPTYSFSASYSKKEVVDWKAIQCKHPVISWIFNESSKRDTGNMFSIVAHTSEHFTKENLDEPEREVVEERIRHALREILGSWAGQPDNYETGFWRYQLPRKFLDKPFLESENELAPLAVVGDYFQGRSFEAAYLSGLRIGEHWVEKYS